MTEQPAPSRREPSAKPSLDASHPTPTGTMETRGTWTNGGLAGEARNETPAPTQPPAADDFRILSLDGGGIRGAFGAAVLAELERRSGRPLTEHFDLIAGSSTGAILGCSLAAGLKGQQLVDFYRDEGEKIFHPRPPFEPRGWLKPFFPLVAAIVKKRTGADFASFFRARYCPEMLEAALTNGLGDLRMHDLQHARVLVPAVDLSDGTIHLFRTPHLCECEPDRNFRVVDVLLAATAAPTYFPHQTLEDGHAYCDGGLWAISPAVAAITEALMIMQGCGEDDCPSIADLSKVRVLSVGTGQSSYSLSPPGSDAGLLYWSSRVADVMSVSQVQGVRPPLQCFLGDRLTTINFELPDSSWRLDRVDLIDDLFELGREKVDEIYDDVAAKFFGSSPASSATSPAASASPAS